MSTQSVIFRDRGRFQLSPVICWRTPEAFGLGILPDTWNSHFQSLLYHGVGGEGVGMGSFFSLVLSSLEKPIFNNVTNTLT